MTNIQRTSIYRSKIDPWLAATLVATIAACAFAGTQVQASAMPGATWIALLLWLVGAVLPLWVLVGTYYTLSVDTLWVRSGPFRWVISVTQITAVTPSGRPSSGPALSLDRLRIDYGRGRSVWVSPRDKTGFVQELEILRRQPD